MLGLKIVTHATRLVFANLGIALRIALLPFVLAFLAIAAAVVLVGLPVSLMVAGGAPVVMGLMRAALLILAFGLIWSAVLWVFVNWHRFVLLAQYPQGWVPPWPKAAMGPYFWRTVQLLLIVAVPTVLILYAVGLGAAATDSPIVSALISYLFYRLSPVLPAAAILRLISIGTAWKTTSRGAGALIVVTLIMTGVQVVATLIPEQIAPINVLLAVILQVVLGFLVGMVQVSILTTIYGHFYEDRPLG